MATLNFPVNPTLNQLYTFENKTWIWNGQGWRLNPTGAINNTPIGNTGPSTGAFTTLSATGNITGNYFIGNGSQLTGIAISTGNIVFDGANLELKSGATETSINITPTGTGNGWIFNTAGNLTAPGAILPTGNGTQHLGSPTQRWGTIYTSGQTIDLAGATISANATSMVLTNPLGGKLIVGGTSTANTSSIVNGNSAVSVTANGNVTFNVAGVANSMVVSDTGVTIAGNLNVEGNVTYINIDSLNVQDPIIGLGRGANNAPLTSNDGKDRGEQLWYYADSEKSAFIGYDNSAGKLIAATDVTITDELVTVNNYGNITLGNVQATSISASGNVTGNYFVGNGTALVGVLADRGTDTNNWNTLTQMGLYTVNRSSWSGVTGAPTDSQVFVGMLEVKNSTDMSITQIFYPGTVEADVKIQWNRANWNGSWTNWIQMTNDGQLLSGGEF